MFAKGTVYKKHEAQAKCGFIAKMVYLALINQFS